MELEFRLKILKDSNQISEDTYENVIKIISIIRQNYNIDISEENGGMFITHIAIALERIKINESVEANNIDEDIYEEILKNEHFEKCKAITNEIQEEININIPEGEERFIIMHLCTMISSACV